jgi:hypothetical protein
MRIAMEYDCDSNSLSSSYLELLKYEPLRILDIMAHSCLFCGAGRLTRCCRITTVHEVQIPEHPYQFDIARHNSLYLGRISDMEKLQLPALPPRASLPGLPQELLDSILPYLEVHGPYPKPRLNSHQG